MTTADEHRIQLRRADSVKWRVRGLSYSQIAEKTGVSKRQAFEDVKAALQESAAERGKDIEDARELELQRLDNAITKVTDVLESELGSDFLKGADLENIMDLISGRSELVLKAADRLVKLSAERSKLLGLYAPTKSEHTGRDGGPLEVATPERAAALVRDRFVGGVAPEAEDDAPKPE